jgi:hypothetical protein
MAIHLPVSMKAALDNRTLLAPFSRHRGEEPCATLRLLCAPGKRTHMPDTRSHRGPHPEDTALFASEKWPILRTATDDLSWLLSRGYALHSTVELVGNRYSLAARQRMAVARCAGAHSAIEDRARRHVGLVVLTGADLWIDGLNVLTSVEVALSGGIVLIAKDGCCRDIAGIHRRYHKVEETRPALAQIGQIMSQLGIKSCRWFLDKPVSNTGRLKTIILTLAAEFGWQWDVELVYSPDAVLSKTPHIVATSDSVILDRCQRWFNLARLAITEHIPACRPVDLSGMDSSRAVL